MASTADPSDDAVSMLCDVTGLAWNEAITRLKASPNASAGWLDAVLRARDSG